MSRTEERRRQILLLHQLGKSVSEIARELNVSRPTVYKVLELARNPEEDPLLDRRKLRSGRPKAYGDDVLQAIASVRSQYPLWGAMLIRHELKSNAPKYGLTPEQVPSVETIALMIRELGLARKPVSPKDKRTFPARMYLPTRRLTRRNMSTNEPSDADARTRFLQMLMETLDELGDYWRHSRFCDEPEVEHFLLVLEDAYHELAQYLEYLDVLDEQGAEQ